MCSPDERSDIWDRPIRRLNPHLRYLGDERGYTRHTVTPKQWQADYRVLERITTPDAPVFTRTSFVVEPGNPGLSRA